MPEGMCAAEGSAGAGAHDGPSAEEASYLSACDPADDPPRHPSAYGSAARRVQIPEDPRGPVKRASGAVYAHDSPSGLGCVPY